MQALEAVLGADVRRGGLGDKGENDPGRSGGVPSFHRPQKVPLVLLRLLKDAVLRHGVQGLVKVANLLHAHQLEQLHAVVEVLEVRAGTVSTGPAPVHVEILFRPSADLCGRRHEGQPDLAFRSAE